MYNTLITRTKIFLRPQSILERADCIAARCYYVHQYLCPFVRLPI